MFELWIKNEKGEYVLHQASDILTDIHWLKTDQESYGYNCEIRIGLENKAD